MNLIIANWKMNPPKLAEAKELLAEVAEEARLAKNSESEIVICPPLIWLDKLMEEFKPKKGLSFGAQNCHWESGGAYTGEISAVMLAEAGVKYVILGHSERRHYFGETDEIINLKIKAALGAKLKPIICVGERAGEEMNLVVEGQLEKDLAGLSVGQMKEIAIAYEPVWAIGTGNACLPDNALSAALFVRRTLTKLYSRFLADKTLVLYGGSVDAQNAAEYIKKARMNGLLVGGASLEAEEFIKIIKNISW